MSLTRSVTRGSLSLTPVAAPVRLASTPLAMVPELKGQTPQNVPDGWRHSPCSTICSHSLPCKPRNNTSYWHK
ncbi:hypothetical protein P4S72_27525 [Vibrio sp. PP-XX7]